MFSSNSRMRTGDTSPPHRLWPLDILQDLPAPYGVPNLHLGRKAWRTTKPLDGECLSVD